MSSFTMPMPILETLVHKPSRASAAAIGQHFVLNGVPPAVKVRGLKALGDMVCDWSVAILEEAINESRHGYLLRRYAIGQIEEILETAIERGYAGLSRQECSRLMAAAQAELKLQCTCPSKRHCGAHQRHCGAGVSTTPSQGFDLEAEPGVTGRIQAVEDLCSHLSQAVEEGFLGQLPDF